MAAMFGAPRAGTGIEAMTSEGQRSSVIPQYRVVVDTGVPACYETEAELSNRGLVDQRKLLLPLSDDGKRVDAVLACIYHELPRKSRARPASRVPRVAINAFAIGFVRQQVELKARQHDPRPPGRSS